MRRLSFVVFALLLSACSKNAAGDAGVATAPTAPPPRSAAAAGTASSATGLVAAQLAYKYAIGLELPAPKIAGLMARHEAACADAGPLVCQVTGSKIGDVETQKVEAHLSLRATPAWVARFRADLTPSVTAVTGKVVETDVTSEDLSRSIVDTDASLRSKTAMRDRLQGLLATRQGKIEDLFAIQKALADAQNDLDTTQSELNAMRQRVAMSDVDIDYMTTGATPPRGPWAPLIRAIGDFTGLMAGSLAAIVAVVGILLPWGLVIGAGAWLALRGRRLMGDRKPARKAK